ncbi:MAG: site-specific integrase [Bacteroidota bacterium]
MSTYEFHNQQLAERVGKDYARTTYVRFTTGLKHIREFLQYHYKREDIPLRKLDHAFISSFDHYLRTVRNINNNSTVKYVSLFRKTIRMAIKNGWLDKDPFANYEGRLRVVDREYLSKDELEILMHKPISHERIETVRDIFVFACYTGLAYVDVAKLKEEHLVRDVEGNYWIRINRTKTDTASMIPILPQAWRLSRNMPTAQIGKSKKYYYLFVPTKKPMPTSRRLLTFVGLPKP